ncbi:MAG: GGDEF domain-containing protein [Myxococcota bacterium]
MASNEDATKTPGSGFRPAPEHESTRKVQLLRRGTDRKVVFPTLRVVAGRDMLRYVTIQEHEELVIGRDEHGGLVLSDASVSRRHARVRSDEHGAITVQDLGSTNGTAVNGVPIERSALRPGDHLEIGAVSLRLDLLSMDELTHLGSVLARLEANNRDPLTRLLTRAWIEEELSGMRDAAARAGSSTACLFADVDQFKGVNDRFGHAVGDDVLVGVARILLVGVRETDACVRYGGEEMLMFLRDTSEAAASEVAERVRRAIEGHDWSRTNPGLRVTASFGVVAARLGEPNKDWINRADRALYAAKARGRNRVVRASEVGEP